MGKLFGTDGVRGVINRDLTPQLLVRLGMSIGTFFGKGSRVLMARDSRSAGDMVTRAVQSGLLSAGVRVYEGGFMPTPALQYGVKHLGYDGGVMITASHNPPQYNGVKVMDNDGVELNKNDEEKVEEIYFEDKFATADWRDLTYDVMREDRVIDVYIKGILSLVDVEKIRKRGFKVAVDGANSVGSITSTKVADLLGCRVYGINTNLDGLFPARNPEPTTDSLKGSALAMKSLEVDLGVAHDGDADRAIFVDSAGRVQWGDRSGVILSQFASKLDKKSPRRIFTAVSSSSLVEEVLSKVGLSVEWTRVGSVVIARELMAKGGVAGFEENGGFIFPMHHPVRDGAMSFAMMLNILAEEGVSSAELFDSLPKYHTIKTKVPLREGLNIDEVYKRLMETYGSSGQVITMDGVKVIGKDFWFLVRKSGTEPIIRIMAESKDLSSLERMVEDIKRTITG